MAEYKEKEKEKKKKEKKQKPDDGFEVLEVFGMKIKVSNPHIADLLTMEATDALSTDIRDLTEIVKSDEVKKVKKPESFPTIDEVKTLDDYHKAVDEIGKEIGFSIETGGIWNSGTGITLIVRPVFEHLNYDRAKLYSTELVRQLEEHGENTAGLFVVGDQVACDIFKAAIQEENLYHKIRIISYDNLYALSGYYNAKYIAHHQVVSLMVPIEGIDAGEFLNIINALGVRHR